MFWKDTNWTSVRSVERGWMDATGDSFAYRCLPLAVANAHGWEILCVRGFIARWQAARTSVR
jgi:hypothetical protein